MLSADLGWGDTSTAVALCYGYITRLLFVIERLYIRVYPSRDAQLELIKCALPVQVLDGGT